MSSTTAPLEPDGSRAGLGPGSVVGGRFEIVRAVGDDALGTLLAARDQKTNRPIAVRVLAPGLIATPDAVETLRRDVKAAAATQHKNLVATYGMGNDKGGARFVATEWVDGQTLAEVIQQRKASGEPLSLRGAYNVVAHVCRGLDAAQKSGSAHGALRPSVVWVTKAGRVKVANLGLDRALVKTAGPAVLGASEQAYLAPEVKAGGEPDARSDVFGLGGLLYGMLTGRSAADDFIAPSAAHPEATAAVDDVLLKCLALDPVQRFATPDEVKSALVTLAGGTAPAEDQHDFGVDVDIDIDIGAPPAAPVTGTRPAIPKPPARPAPPPSAKAAQANSSQAKPPQATPQVGARVAVDQSFRPHEMSAPALSAEVDLGGLLSKITENDAARWMVVKDNLDHGPFSGRELVQLILKGDVLADHGLLNLDSGQRRKVKDAPEFAEFAEQFKMKKAAAEHTVALARSATREKRSFVAKGAILAAVIAVVGLGVGIFFITRPDAAEEELADADLTDLYERGEIEITGSAGLLEDPAPNQRRGRRRGGGRSGLSYEDAMNEVVDLGNVAQGGSMSRLTPQQVAGVMNQNINRLLPCVAREPNVGTVRIEMAIAGSGQVLGASVRTGSPAFQSCVVSKVRAVRFPSFSAPRMGASFTFSAD